LDLTPVYPRGQTGIEALGMIAPLQVTTAAASW
jgi:hypothetical protein